MLSIDAVDSRKISPTMRWKRTADSHGVASERQGRAVGWRRIGAARMISINHSGRRDAERTSSLPLSTGNPSSISLISFSRAFRSRNNPQDGRAQWGAEWQQEGWGDNDTNAARDIPQRRQDFPFWGTWFRQKRYWKATPTLLLIIYLLLSC